MSEFDCVDGWNCSSLLIKRISHLLGRALAAKIVQLDREGAFEVAQRSEPCRRFCFRLLVLDYLFSRWTRATTVEWTLFLCLDSQTRLHKQHITTEQSTSSRWLEQKSKEIWANSFSKQSWKTESLPRKQHSSKSPGFLLLSAFRQRYLLRHTFSNTVVCSQVIIPVIKWVTYECSSLCSYKHSKLNHINTYGAPFALNLCMWLYY